VKRSHFVTAALLATSILALTGCFNGQQATTTTQAAMNTGNGVQTQQGPIRIENATLVVSNDDTNAATLLVRLVNEGATPDALVYATVNAAQAEIITPPAEGDAATTLQPGASASYGWESELRIDVADLDVPLSTYVPVELGFAEAGLSKLWVLTVPQAGYYEDVTVRP
jgi:hypothetical protein